MSANVMAKPKYTNWGEVPMLLRVTDVSDVLGVHINTVKKLILAGQIPAKKVGREWRVTKEDLRAYVEDTDDK